MFSFNIRNKARMSALIPSIQHCTSGSSQDNQAKKKKKKKKKSERERERKKRKRNKRHPDWKGRSKTVFEDDMIL